MALQRQRRPHRAAPHPRFEGRRIHPALHIDDMGVVLGRVTDAGKYQLITSERRIYTPSRLKSYLLFQPRPYPDLAGRWPDSDVNRFWSYGGAPSFSEVLALILEVLDGAMEFPQPGHSVLIAIWIIASYFLPLFLSFPRLALSGERESGKSKLLMILKATCWNALLMLAPTSAVLYRLVQEFRPTLLLDEMEGLYREDAGIRAFMNSGYKRDGTVPRCEGEKTKRVELFHVYSPMAFASIRPVNPTTEDRSIPLTMQRGTEPQRINLEVDTADQVFARIRAGCCRLLLSRWREVEEMYKIIALPDWLRGRARELWRPLLAIAGLADGERDLGITSTLLALAKEHVQDRQGISAESEALINALAERLGSKASMIIRPGDLTEDLRRRLGWRDAPTPEFVGSLLRRLGFSKAKPPRDRAGVRYEVTAERLKDVQARYSPSETYKPTSSGANSTSAKDFSKGVGADEEVHGVGSARHGRADAPPHPRWGWRDATGAVGEVTCGQAETGAIVSDTRLGQEELLTIKEVSTLLRVPRSWLYERTRRNEIPCFKIGKYLRFRREEVLAWREQFYRDGKGFSLEGR